MSDSPRSYPEEVTVYCPWPERGNPWFEADVIDAEVIDWYLALDPPDSSPGLVKLRAGDLTCRLFPDAVDRDVLVAAAQHILSGTFYDDHLTSSAVSAAHIQACSAAAMPILEGTEAAERTTFDCPFLGTVRAMAARWRAVMHDADWSRVSASWSSYLENGVLEQEIGTTDAYLAWRHIDEGSGVFTALLPALGCYAPTREVWDDRRLAALRQGAGLVTGIDNDLVSPGAEENRAQILDLLAAERGANAADAVFDVTALRDLLTCRMERLAGRLSGGGGLRAETPDGRSVLIDPGQFTHFVPANLGWFRASRRYRERSGSPFIALEVTREHPVHDCEAAPPYPAVAWWWDL